MDKLQLVHSTDRLQFRPLCLDDVPYVQKYASDFEVAKTTLAIPHPYPEDGAKTFIESLPPLLAEGKFIAFAMILKETNELIGTISLVLNSDHKNGDLGYWVGKPHWGKGYATEAARKVLEIGFKEFDLNRIHACAFTNNPASSKVMEKIGMKHEGVFRKHYLKWGEFLDVTHYGILKEEFERQKI